MRTRIAITLLAAALCAACAPTYRVYNGGIDDRRAGPLADMKNLSPTEAVVTFSTDYARPGENASYGGPTNRVATNVPAGEVQHEFVSYSSTTVVQRVSVVTTPKTAAVTAHAASGVKSSPPRVLGDTAIAEAVIAPEQGLALGGPLGLAGGSGVKSQAVAEETKAAEARVASRGLSGGEESVDLVSASDSKSAAGKSMAFQPLATQTSKSSGGTAKVAGIEVMSKDNAARQAADTVVAKGESGTSAAQDVAMVGQLLAAGTMGSPERDSNIATLAADTAAHSGKVLTSSGAAKLTVKREVVSDVGGPRLLVSWGGPLGLTAFTRYGLHAELSTSKAAGIDTGGGAAGGRLTSESVAGLGDAAAPADVTSAVNGFDITGTRTYFRSARLEELETVSKVNAPKELTAVSPPGLEVGKEASLIQEAGIKSLLREGTLKNTPRSNAIIRYRILVFNASESAAVDINILDRLDAKSELLVDSMYTTSTEAKARFDQEKKMLLVTLPRLEAEEQFMLEFYVEPPAGE